jgi:hypothetical protein
LEIGKLDLFVLSSLLHEREQNYGIFEEIELKWLIFAEPTGPLAEQL